MSLPPVAVHIKRKRTDEPVDFLRVEESNKRRATAFVFSRQPSFDETPTSTTTPPELRRIKQLPHSSNAPSLKTSVYPPRTQADTSGSSERGLYGIGPGPSQDPKVAIPSNNVSTLSAPGEFQIPPPRRFHISRSAVPTNPLSPSTSGVRRKRKVEPTIFVERRKKPRTPAEEASSKTNNNNNNDDDDSATTLVSEPQVFRQQKKPGRAARTATPPLSSSTTLKPSAAPLRNVRLPSGAVIPWDVNSDQLAAEMEAYTLQEIGKNIAQAEAETAKPKIASSPRRSPSKFKPQKPALRYAERHPREIAETAMDVDEEFVEEEDIDESDYIIDTYFRIPAEALETTDASKNIGLLILDSQPDIDEFYREHDEMDEEEEDDDEDENAEDHYTADYPEDEVDSDDEFNRNAYHYRNGNASDLEEFDQDDEARFSGDEEGSNYPWAKQPVWMKREKTILDDGDDDM